MPVTVEVRAGVAHMVLDAPPLNILTREVMQGLREALAGVAGDAEARVILLTAAGRHFSAGAAVEEHLPGTVEAMIPEFMETVALLETAPAPVVVAVQGRCLGGGVEVALAGDLVVAGEGTVLALPEIALGVFPPAACLQLPRLAGPALAAEMVLTGAPLDAERAERAGLFCRVVPDDRVQEEARALAETLACHSGAALRMAKRGLRVGSGAGRSAGAGAAGDAGAEAEVTRLYLEELMATADAREGLEAFMEKRQPRW
ncbi:MAG: enoyl-CoA hydratase-related protein, partial [Longimicrobiales bacterium]|nr:enoyl-CoA hydratase-related protein [Longimicrobiales bacterium]